MTGRIIVFEGVDGTGKSTLAEMLAKDLDAIYYAFPGKEPYTLGSAVYNIHHSTIEACPESMQLLHIAAHINALKTRIIPWLAAGKTVVLDRFYWSTYVYGLAYDVPITFLREIIKLELPYWESYLDSAVLFLVTRPEPFDKHDDAKSLKQWHQIHDLYDHVFANDKFDSINRLYVENVGNLMDTFNVVKSFVKDTSSNEIQES
jgi:dTMP kinase